MNCRFALALVLFSLTPGVLFPQTPSRPMVRFSTPVGTIDVQLLPDIAPATVANFLNYMNRGDYDNSIFHRSVSGFIIQGGGYHIRNGQLSEIPADAPVVNEYRMSNLRGTIAMAKLGDDPNSATNQWFFNLGNNSQNLDNQNGGFTVFGRIATAAGLTTMDRVASVPVVNAGGAFNELPLLNYTGGQIGEFNYVRVTSVRLLDTAPAPVISTGGIISAGAFGALPAAAPGSFIEIYGTNLAGAVSRSWNANDFNEGRAPTSLESVTVTIGGRPAYVSYVSPEQVNVQVPADTPVGESVPVVVTRGTQASAPANLAVRSLAGMLLAPPAFKVDQRQYAVAFHADGSYVSNGSISGYPASPARPGETLVLYGIGFGPLDPSGTPVAGQMVSGLTSLRSPVEFKIGQLTAQTVFAGLTPNLVGLYQFNVVVPANAASGDLPLEVSQGGTAVPQTLYLPVTR